MYRFLMFALGVSLCTAAKAVEVPSEHQKFIVERADAGKSYARQLCERFELCETIRFDRSVALVIGVSNYPYLTNLPSTKDDAQKIRDFLIDSGEFDQVVFLTDADATKDRIEYFMDDYFPALLAESGKRSRFFFYFSGHGETASTGTGNERGFLRLSNNKPGSFYQSIGMDVVASWANHSLGAATHGLFVIDACLSGLIGREVKGATQFSIERDPRDLMKFSASYILTAGADKQEAVAGVQWGGSLFTAALLDALRTGKADTSPPDGVTTSGELFAYVEGAVSNATGNQQTPRRFEVKKVRSGDFFFLTPQRRLGSENPESTEKSRRDMSDEAAAGAIWHDIKETRSVEALNAFAERHKSSSYSILALQRIDEVLNSQTESLEPWEKWGYWKGRGLWNNEENSCRELGEFIRKTTRISELKYSGSDQRPKLSGDRSDFKTGKIDGNFFVRSEQNADNKYCGVFKGENAYFLSCSRKITRNRDVFDSVYRKSAGDIRRCLGSQGWIEYTAKDIVCSTARLQESKSCSHGFQRGPQTIWLRTNGEGDGSFALGLWFVIENFGIFKVVQGDYEFDSNGKLLVAARESKVRTLYNLDLGRIESIEIPNDGPRIDYEYERNGIVKRIRSRKGQGQSEWNVTLNRDGNVSEVRDEKGGLSLSIEYNNVFAKPSKILAPGLGQVRVTYDLQGEITKTETDNPDQATKIMARVNAFLDLVSEVYE